jgi:DNA/RNA-binding domain of Phe-tRNA-synthetase-like protein
MAKYDLLKLLREELGNGSKDLVTRPSGQAIRERIERDIEKEPEGSVTALDFSKIGVIDYSCADEVIAKLVSRLLSNEYGDRYLVLTGLNENQLENIEVALERKDLAVLAETRDGARTVLGNLNNYLKDTFDVIAKKKKVTSKDLADARKLEANTSGTRLLNLHKKRLVRRVEEVRTDGKIWVYETL